MTALLVLLTLWLAWDLGRHWGDGGLGRLRDDDRGVEVYVETGYEPARSLTFRTGQLKAADWGRRIVGESRIDSTTWGDAQRRNQRCRSRSGSSPSLPRRRLAEAER